MTVSIRFWRGKEAELPISAPSGTPMWCEDSEQLWVGTGTGRRLIGPIQQGGPSNDADSFVVTTDDNPVVTHDGTGLTYAGSY